MRLVLEATYWFVFFFNSAVFFCFFVLEKRIEGSRECGQSSNGLIQHSISNPSRGESGAGLGSG